MFLEVGVDFVEFGFYLLDFGSLLVPSFCAALHRVEFFFELLESHLQFFWRGFVESPHNDFGGMHGALDLLYLASGRIKLASELFKARFLASLCCLGDSIAKVTCS